MPRRLLPLAWAAALLSCANPLPELSPFKVSGFPLPVQTQLEDAYERAVAHPRDAAINGRLGMVYQAYEQWEAAESAYRRAGTIDANNFQWPYLLGVVQEAQSRHAESVASLRQALRLMPQHLPARLRLADGLIRLSQFGESEQIYRGILRDHQELAEAHFGLARTLDATSRTEAAIGSFEAACARFPGYGAAHYQLSMLYRRLGNATKAAEHLAAFEANKQGTPERADEILAAVAELQESSAALLRRGQQRESSGDHLAAAELHERAIAVDPTNFWAHGNLVWIYTKLGDPQKAEDQYRAALKLDETQPRLHLYYGVLQVGQGRLDEAEKAFKRALELDPKYADAYFNLGAIAERRGRKDEAARLFGDAVKFQPENRRAHHRLGHVLLQLGQEQRAEQEFLALIVPASDETQALQAVANSYLQSGRTAAGVRFARKAVKLADERRMVSTVAELKRLFPGSD